MNVNWVKKLKQDEEGRRLLEQERLIVEVTEAMASLLKERKVSRSELARRIGKSPAFVTKLLRGDNNFTLRTLSDVFFALGHSAHFSLADNSNRPRGNTPRRGDEYLAIARSPCPDGWPLVSDDRVRVYKD